MYALRILELTRDRCMHDDDQTRQLGTVDLRSLDPDCLRRRRPEYDFQDCEQDYKSMSRYTDLRLPAPASARCPHCCLPASASQKSSMALVGVRSGR